MQADRWRLIHDQGISPTGARTHPLCVVNFSWMYPQAHAMRRLTTCQLAPSLRSKRIQRKVQWQHSIRVNDAKAHLL